MDSNHCLTLPLVIASTYSATAHFVLCSSKNRTPAGERPCKPATLGFERAHPAGRRGAPCTLEQRKRSCRELRHAGVRDGT